MNSISVSVLHYVYLNITTSLKDCAFSSDGMGSSASYNVKVTVLLCKIQVRCICWLAGIFPSTNSSSEAKANILALN